MENSFDYDKIDFDNIPEQDRFWIFTLLMFAFANDKDLDRLQKLKERIEKELDKQ